VKLWARSEPVARLVPGNRWDQLEVPAIGGLSPRLRLAVIIPYFQAREELERTLFALAEQSYPRHLFQVIVVDDGSEPPLHLPANHVGLDLTVLRQPRNGFGAARARNLGAAAASADVLVFLDADMIPEPVHLEAHARWHHAGEHLAVLGARRHVELEDISPEMVGVAARTGRLDPLFASRRQQVPEWLEDHYERTGELTSDHDDLFRVVASGNLSIGSRTFHRVGGFDGSFDSWGGEDTELGYRLFVSGALLVLERAAQCWHQGAGATPDADELCSLDRQRARLAHLIAHRGFRRTTRGRTYELPRVAVEVDAGTRSRQEIAATVESVLASDLSDLTVALRVPESHPDRLWLHRQFGHDLRVLVSGDPSWNIPYWVRVPAGAVMAESAITGFVARLSSASEAVGVINVTVPRRRPKEACVRAWTARSVGRVAGGPPRDAYPLLDAAGELFGSAWLSGYDAGVHWHGDPGEPPAEASSEKAEQRSARGDANALWAVLSELPVDQQALIVSTARTTLAQLSPRQLGILLRIGRRAIALLTAIGSLGTVRNGRGLRRSLVRLTHAALPWRLVRASRGVRGMERTGSAS
jgi:GT2 family glycosyltransferase